MYTANGGRIFDGREPSQLRADYPVLVDIFRKIFPANYREPVVKEGASTMDKVLGCSLMVYREGCPGDTHIIDFTISVKVIGKCARGYVRVVLDWYTRIL